MLFPPELIDLDHESSCQSECWYFCSALCWIKYVIIPLSFPTESYYHKAYASELLKILCISYDLQHSLKIVLRSVEVEDPFSDINSRETKELMVVTRERVRKWTHGHKPANFKKLFERNEGMFKRGGTQDLTFCWHLSLITKCVVFNTEGWFYQQKPNVPNTKKSTWFSGDLWKKEDEMLWKKK